MDVFFYDGKCPFCTKTANYLQERCLNKNIHFLSFRNLSDKEIQNIHKDLSLELLTGNTQFIFRNTRYPHFFGIRKLFPYLRGYRYFTLFLYLPLVPLFGILFLQILKKITRH
ncbi:MAG: DUF393 domain-containing protein [Leptospiraceae bacterium]|nr:DUF393 domain-containing protein [Leptospiraceae bacterium]